MLRAFESLLAHQPPPRRRTLDGMTLRLAAALSIALLAAGAAAVWATGHAIDAAIDALISPAKP